MACFYCFQKELYAVLCLKEDEGGPLTESLFFLEIKQWNCPFAVFSLLKLILIVMKLSFLIDNNMQWALIDLLWYSFCIHDYSFFCGCFLVACYFCFQSYMQFCASRQCLALTESDFLETKKFRFSLLCCLCSLFGNDTLGFDWIFVFRRPKNLDLLYLLSLFRVLIDCDYDETVLFELMITWTGLWLTCFDSVFVYKSIGFSAVALNWLATSVFKKLCNLVPQGNAWLWLSLCFFSET